ncbi:hypothetical protein L2E69_03095 [Planktothrix agardhii 1806]|nr:hypothetical protein [Planktothrix agardhii 1805]MCF3583607.1 hypothetical protein [Planktothrix agardhii 1803]MCF3604257.1 hypothetical protein [Planktothrix agardhii 1804]MCF3608179.1 hypothetical protein [Planktothrix agardhii 1033]MCF3614937.1 hypothetical protein [Planktothrix agardhii 1806]MCP9294891.1 hypothetical protein [Planktothrix agardhii LY1]
MLGFNSPFKRQFTRYAMG